MGAGEGCRVRPDALQGAEQLRDHVPALRQGERGFKNATDFYEVELCVGATVGGMYVGGVEGTAVHPDSGITLNGV